MTPANRSSADSHQSTLGRCRRPPAVAFLILLAAFALTGCGEPTRLRAGCMAGDLSQCVKLGDMYAAGNTVAKDPGRAAEMYERACEGGVASVCNTLGLIYDRTDTPLGGQQRVMELFQKACEGNSLEGCINLGQVLAEREDYPGAAMMFEKACAGGAPLGCYHLAVAYEKGEGVKADLPKAVDLYEQACTGSHVESCVVLAQFYTGSGTVAPDRVRATAYYQKAIQIRQKACEAGDDSACGEVGRLRARIATLPPGRIASPRLP